MRKPLGLYILSCEQNDIRRRRTEREINGQTEREQGR